MEPTAGLNPNWLKTAAVDCKESQFPEFPHIPFGKFPEGRSCFSTAASLKKTGRSIDDFLRIYSPLLVNVASSNGIKLEESVVRTPQGEVVMDACFLFLFISYVEPDFMAFMCDRMDELFSNGFTVSDSYLLAAVHARIPSELLINHINDKDS